MSIPDGFNDKNEIIFIPDRLIQEPTVYLGLTDSEIVSLAVGGLVFWLPVSVLLLFPFGFGLFGVGLGFGLTLLTIVIAGKKLSKLKRTMPDGQHVVHIRQLVQAITPISYNFIDYEGSWSIRRHQRVERVSYEDDLADLDEFITQNNDLTEFQPEIQSKENHESL